MTWIMNNLHTIAVLAALVAIAAMAHRMRHLEHALRGQRLELGAVRERAGVTEADVDDYHARVHPCCVEAGER